jgi:cell division protein FtsN
MLINFNIFGYKCGSCSNKSESRLLSSSLLQKNKKKAYLSAAIIFTILGLALNAYPVSLQNPGIFTRKPADINLVLQVGAFIKETNATVFKEKLAALIDKQVIMVIEEGYYKVQLIGFKNIEEIEKIIPALGLIGIKDFWIPPVKKDTVVPDRADLQPDTIQKPPEEKVVNTLIPVEPDSLVTEETPGESADTYALEIGSFRKENRALNAQEKVISKLKLPVEIVEQWNDYHVIITGFNNKTEINKYIPELASMGFNEIFVIKNYKKSQ